ncbi:MAG: hypothetical protein KC502_17835 [Myxococcales bacterium]|nr:hypothetical protein [Myxococcales bacterium]
MTTQQHFTALPGLAGSYGRALIGRKSGLSAGQTLARFEASVAPVHPDPAALAQYSDLCGFERGDLLPPTYPHVLAVPLHMAMLTHKAFPLATLGLVHVRQTIDQYVPMPAAKAIELRCHVEGHQPARKGVTFDLITEALIDGELCWRGVTTVLARNKEGRGEPPTADKEPVIAERKLQVDKWQVPADLGRRYAAIAGDRNPIHLYGVTAKLFGFKKAIIHGMWTMAHAMANRQAQWPEGPVRFSCDFKRPIFMPSSVEFVHEPLPSGGEAFAVWRPGTDKLHVHGQIEPIG